jgi:hypothetical protein
MMAALMLLPGCENPAASTDGTLTAPVSFVKTIKDTSLTAFDGKAWEGDGTASEYWALEAVEQPVVYFAVNKAEAQTITAGGPAAALVEKAQIRQTMDGSRATGALDVFKVDTGDLEAMFGGGVYRFTLTVTEQGKRGVTITVDLGIKPNPRGVAVFSVEKGKKIKRVSGIKSYKYPDQDASTLLDALVWLDTHGQTGQEYLLRVEKNETIPRLILYFQNSADFTVRLRGYGGERIITHDGSRDLYYNPYLGISTSSHSALITLYEGKNSRFCLEEGVTLKGTESSPSAEYGGLIEAGKGWRMVMREGSKITGHYRSGSSLSGAVVYVDNDSGGNAGFEMDGGAITGNKADGAIVAFKRNSGDGVFVKTGGIISGNTKIDGSPNNSVWFYNSDTAVEITEGQDYSLPPLPY